MNKEQLDKLTRLEAAATPGAWERDVGYTHSQDLLLDMVRAADGRSVCDTLNAEHRELTHDGDAWSDSVGSANMKLVAASRNALPDLLASAHRLLELESQLAFVHASGHCGADIMTPERIAAWAVELGWKGVT